MELEKLRKPKYFNILFYFISSDNIHGAKQQLSTDWDIITESLR